MYVYQLNDRPFDENTPRQYFQVTGSSGNYKLNQDPVINVSEKVGFGIMTYDRNSASSNQNGVYSITLKLDDETIYHAEWERFFFPPFAWYQFSYRLSCVTIIKKEDPEKLCGARQSTHNL